MEMKHMKGFSCGRNLGVEADMVFAKDFSVPFMATSRLL